MIIKEGRYSIKHTIHMADYETIVVEHSVSFDIDDNDGIVSSAFETARLSIDNALKEDLRRAAECTHFDGETYIHDWIEEVYN